MELLFGIFAFLGFVFGVLALLRITRLQRQLEDLLRRFEQIRKGLEDDRNIPVPVRRAAKEPVIPELQAETLTEVLPASSRTSPREARPVSADTVSDGSPRWQEQLQEHWMSWLGGTCVGLAGIFLVRYSIEQGMLGPIARIAVALLSGLMLHLAARWLRLRKGAHPALAALAAGGSITLFAGTLAALHLYQIFSPLMAFAILAIIAIGTMWLALLHGPLLSVLGIFGAYTVPLMIGAWQNNADSILLYILVISAAGLLLLRHVNRLWLWKGIITGALLWWWITLDAASANLARGWYLATFVWLLYAIPSHDWLLRKTGSATGNSPGLRRYWHVLPGAERICSSGTGLVIAAAFMSILISDFDDATFLQWAPLSLIVMYLAGRRQHLVIYAWGLLALSWLAWLILYGISDQLTPGQQAAFYWYCLNSSLVYMLMALRNARLGDWQPWLPMLLLAPLGFLVLAWFVTPQAQASLQWLLLAVLLGVIYMGLAAQALRERLAALATAWFFIASHVAYSLAVAMYLREASMTLALAVQLVSLGWLVRRFDLPALGLLIKAVVVLLVCRLSLNPWLVQYPDDVHWTLWTYGGATLCCWLGSRYLNAHAELQAWARGATVHLLALTIWVEIRFWLYDGQVFSSEFSALEAGLNAGIFAALGLIYHWREQFSHYLARVYRVYSYVLLLFALGNYGIILLATWSNSFWISREVGTTWLMNSMWLLYGVPAVMALATAKWYLPATKRFALGVAGVAVFIFVTLQIRHFWQGSISLAPAVLDAELYSYSAVWLLMAVIVMLSGAWKYGRDCYRAGMLLLLLVVAKLFLVDMSDLQGLYRVMSFLGMGLGLLAVAYLHKRLQPAAGASVPVV